MDQATPEMEPVLDLSQVHAPGVKDCPVCGERPVMRRRSTAPEIKCCDTDWSPVLDWNLYAGTIYESVGNEPTPEEDEAFEELERKNNPEPEWPMAALGRNIERFGKLLQDRNSTVVDLVAAARDAGFNLRVGIQPEVEDTTDEYESEQQ